MQEYIIDFVKILILIIIIIIILEQNNAIINNGNILGGGDGRWTCYDEGDKRWCHKEL